MSGKKINTKEKTIIDFLFFFCNSGHVYRFDWVLDIVSLLSTYNSLCRLCFFFFFPTHFSHLIKTMIKQGFCFHHDYLGFRGEFRIGKRESTKAQLLQQFCNVFSGSVRQKWSLNIALFLFSIASKSWAPCEPTLAPGPAQGLGKLGLGLRPH